MMAVLVDGACWELRARAAVFLVDWWGMGTTAPQLGHMPFLPAVLAGVRT